MAKRQRMIEQLRRILRGVAMTRQVEYSCDEAFRFFDELAEAAARGEDLDRFKPKVIHHLRQCPECLEDFEALLHSIEGVTGEDLPDV